MKQKLESFNREVNKYENMALIIKYRTKIESHSVVDI